MNEIYIVFTVKQSKIYIHTPNSYVGDERLEVLNNFRYNYGQSLRLLGNKVEDIRILGVAYGAIDLVSIINEYEEPKAVKQVDPTKHKYEGYMNDEAIKFFGDNVHREDRDGCGASGSFVKLGNGTTCLPMKGDMFIKKDSKIYRA